jgi:hypothetical protein
MDMKPGFRQLVREALGGAILGIVGALAGAIACGRHFGPLGPVEAFIGLFSGATLGYTLGVSLGVWVVGRLSGTGGSFWLALGGAVLGAGWLGLLLAVGLTHAFVYLAIPGYAAALILAVLGFHRGLGALCQRLKEYIVKRLPTQRDKEARQ